jgi:uncharacterized membrane protein
MPMPTEGVREAVERYFGDLRSALDSLPDSERDDVVEEIRTHVLERIGAETDITAVREVLRAVGEPRELASQYVTQALLRRAARSRSPWLLLRTTFRWATTGAAGAVAFLITVLGYGCAIVCYLTAVLKPLFPARLGLWASADRTLTLGYCSPGPSPVEMYGISLRPPTSFVLGTLGPSQGPVRELLGAWLIPVGIVAGMLCAVATTFLVRRLIGRFGSPREPGARAVTAPPTR